MEFLIVAKVTSLIEDEGIVPYVASRTRIMRNASNRIWPGRADAGMRWVFQVLLCYFHAVLVNQRLFPEA